MFVYINQNFRIYKFLTIGNITQLNGPSTMNSKIYLLDVRNYTWVYTFEPSTPSNPPNPPNAPNPSNPQNPTSPNASASPYIPPNTSESSNQLATMRIVIAT